MKRMLWILIGMLLALAILPVAAQTQEDTFGRDALATLENGEALVYAYDAICTALTENTTDTEVTVDLSTQGYRIKGTQLKTLVQLIAQDRPEFFWLAKAYSYYVRNDYVSMVILKATMTGEEREAAQQAIDRATWNLLAGIRSDMTEAEKALYIHDRLAGHVTYSANINGTYVHDLYGALALGDAVCEGYAEAYQYLLRKVGMESFVVTGTGNGGDHAWNYVRIDGKYYQTDVTWDDQETELYHAYYNLTDQAMLKDHALDSVPYALPTCNSTEAFYFTGDTYLDTYTVESVVRLHAENGLTIHVYVPGDAMVFWKWYCSHIGDIVSQLGIRNANSYGMRMQGNELVLYIKTSNVAAVADASGNVTHYATLQRAVDACTEGKYLVLLEDAEADITLKKDLILDLDGHCLTGRIKTNGYRIFGWDSTTDHYQGNRAGVFQCTDDAGKAVTPQTSAETPDGRKYLAVNSNGSYSFHCFDLTLTRVRLRPGEEAISFWAVVRGDPAVLEALHPQKALGIGVGLDGGKTVERFREKNALVSGKPVILKISDYDVDHHGQDAVQISLTLRGADGTVLHTYTYETNARQVLETLNTQSLSGGIMSLLRAFIEKHSVIRQWNTENLWK